jgi:mono/diheme cytochrome c family protein
MDRTRKQIWVAAVVLAATTALFSAARAQQPVPGAAPTYNAQVAAILNANCVTCHRPEGTAPFSLMTYQDAKRNASGIAGMTASRAMPPWFADPRYGQFKNARGLTAAQIQTLAAWNAADAPEGTGTAPRSPTFASGWHMDRPPDQIIELPFGEFELPPSGEVPAFTVWLKPFRDDRFVQAMELRPSLPNAVHHSSLAVGRMPPNTRIGKGPIFPGGPELDGASIRNDGTPFFPNGGEYITDVPIMFYVPGGGFLQLQNGLGKRFRRDDFLSWGLHLISRGQVEKLRVQLGLWYARRQPHHEVRMITLTETLEADGKPIGVDAGGERQFPVIPPGVANWSMTGSRKFTQDITVYALWPHMHYRGKDMTFVLTLPNGKQETLLSVPAYNPHWQLTYELAKPLKVKRGSVITAYGHYDNSMANLHNPDPTATVKFGQQGTDEMFLPFMEVSVDDQDLTLEQFQMAPR